MCWSIPKEIDTYCVASNKKNCCCNGELSLLQTTGVKQGIKSLYSAFVAIKRIRLTVSVCCITIAASWEVKFANFWRRNIFVTIFRKRIASSFIAIIVAFQVLVLLSSQAPLSSLFYRQIRKLTVSI